MFCQQIHLRRSEFSTSKCVSFRLRLPIFPPGLAQEFLGCGFDAAKRAFRLFAHGILITRSL